MKLALSKSSLAVVLLLCVGSASWATTNDDNRIDEVAHDLPDKAYAGEVLLLGESHGRQESYLLAEQILLKALSKRRCVAVALEISADEADALRSFMSGGDYDSIRMYHVIGTPIYKDFLHRLRRLSAKNCITVHAVDAPREGTLTRDEHAAISIEKLIGKDRLVFGLYGNFHVAKQLDWRHLAKGVNQSLAWLLNQREISVYSIAQDWLPACPGMILVGDSPSGVVVSREIMSGAKVYPPTQEKPMADQVVCWSTDREAS